MCGSTHSSPVAPCTSLHDNSLPQLHHHCPVLHCTPAIPSSLGVRGNVRFKNLCLMDKSVDTCSLIEMHAVCLLSCCFHTKVSMAILRDVVVQVTDGGMFLHTQDEGMSLLDTVIKTENKHFEMICNTFANWYHGIVSPSNSAIQAHQEIRPSRDSEGMQKHSRRHNFINNCSGFSGNSCCL